MTKCPSCSSGNCYNSGFTIECATQGCRFFTEKQHEAVHNYVSVACTRKVTQEPADHGECPVSPNPCGEIELSRRCHYEIRSIQLATEVFYGVEQDAKGEEIWRGRIRKTTNEAWLDCTKQEIWRGRIDAHIGDLLRDDSGRLFRLTEKSEGPFHRAWEPVEPETTEVMMNHCDEYFVDISPGDFGVEQYVAEAPVHMGKLRIGDRARLPSRPSFGIGTVEAFDGDGTKGDYGGDVGIDFGEDFKGLSWRPRSKICFLARERTGTSDVFAGATGYGWEFPSYPKIAAADTYRISFTARTPLVVKVVTQYFDSKLQRYGRQFTLSPGDKLTMVHNPSTG